MITPLSKTSGFLYESVAKPILFRFAADAVHETMIRTGSVLQAVPPLRSALRIALRYDHPMLRTRVAGVDFPNPVGLSAGLDKDAKIVPLLQAVGFGYAECGSITRHPYGGNAQPWFTRLPNSKSIVVNSGLRSEGVQTISQRIAAYDKHLLHDFPLNLSVAKTNSQTTATLRRGVQDYCESLAVLEKMGRAGLYTINISCPNTFGGEPYTSPQTLQTLLDAIDKLRLKRPLFVKLPIDKSWRQTDALLRVAARHNVQGITIGNLQKNRKAVTLQDPLSPAVKGNLSGKPCWEASNDLLARAYAAYGDRFALVGVGGVFSAEDAYTKIKLGASLVELVTGLIFRGPSLIGMINKELVQLLRADGYASVAQAVGADVKKRKGKL